jgi:hypothetical protein
MIDEPLVIQRTLLSGQQQWRIANLHTVACKLKLARNCGMGPANPAMSWDTRMRGGLLHRPQLAFCLSGSGIDVRLVFFALAS